CSYVCAYVLSIFSLLSIMNDLSRLLFFSSRRRHTRSKRDWSSDVCLPIFLKQGLPMTLGVILYASWTGKLVFHREYRPLKPGHPQSDLGFSSPCLPSPNGTVSVQRCQVYVPDRFWEGSQLLCVA